jgi:hypothetical protein
MMNSHSDIKQKIIGFWLIILMCVVIVMLLPAISQDANYHDFADQRQLLSIAHFWNVISNVPFLLVGYWGLKALRVGEIVQFPKSLINCYRVFFAAIAVVGIGSMVYHLQPSNETLVWDRLPMTVAFMAFFSLIIGEYINESIGKNLLWPLVLLGGATVVYWAITEAAGVGDLRPYALIQFAPMILIPYLLLTMPTRYSHQCYVWAMLLTYLIAKIFEALDHNIYAIGQMMGGHAIKHVCAALGPYLFYLGLKRRQLITLSTDSDKL